MSRVPVVAQWKRIRLGTMRLLVQFLASLSGLRIQCCSELWCRLQMKVRSGLAVTLAQACVNSSDQTPSLGISLICRGCGSKRTKKTKKKIKNKLISNVPYSFNLEDIQYFTQFKTLVYIKKYTKYIYIIKKNNLIINLETWSKRVKHFL